MALAASKPHKPGDETSMAGQVLNLPELLEMIILNLPMRDMQRIRRVSKQWQAAVDNSLPTKRALFQEPGTMADLAHDDYCLNQQTKEVYRGTKFSTHPHFRIPAPGRGEYLDVLIKRAHRIPNVFLTQPPTPSAMIIVALYCPGRNGLDTFIKLQANETFGTLSEKIVQLLELHPHDASNILWWWMEMGSDSDSEEEQG
ncbi:hypothetical protein LTS10_000120 [Elasticomyces elasticus]|nr:hypothetical protein LTS10_000120 [Elasticomyces elasticus]